MALSETAEDELRRELITGVVSAPALNTARGLRRRRARPRSAYDQQFARTMEVGMADYELHMRTVKDEPSATSRSSTTPRGTLVEIGMGTGPNMRWPSRTSPTSWASSPTRNLTYAYENANRYGARSIECVTVRRVASLGDASVDTVVSTLVMCTVDDVERTLAEVRRVLRGRAARTCSSTTWRRPRARRCGRCRRCSTR